MRIHIFIQGISGKNQFVAFAEAHLSVDDVLAHGSGAVLLRK